MKVVFQDSTGKPISVGDPVLFRGEKYTIKEFLPGKGRWGCAAIEFNEEQHTDEVADECSVDLLILR